MNASQSIDLGALPALAGGSAAGARGLSPFRRLLAAVWTEQAQPLAALALGLGLKRDQAADALQDVFVMAIDKPPAITDAAELKRWLFRVTVNRCHLEHRRKGRWRRLWSTLAGAWRGDAVNAAAVLKSELKGEVDQALSKLEADDRALVVMRYFSDLNSREIAEIVGIPEATVRGRLRAARRKLAKELASWNDED
ncbi:MAG TPA: sigma-70 family RNA polymerase sigma factor [Pirellulaceae bacterium]|nr:sigma-70 family RNA polymerase sigma factor [Pirellulaceae bacterium]